MAGAAAAVADAEVGRGLSNNGAEVHEMVVVRIADGVTESLEELLAIEGEGRDTMAEGSLLPSQDAVSWCVSRGRRR